jgi:hypothetical protein
VESTVNKLEQLKDGIRAQAEQEQARLPLMNVEKMREELLSWLAVMKLPVGVEAESWEDLIQVFPAEEGEQEMDTGVRARLALRLSTRENRYLISILESLEPDSRGTYLIGAHVNWKSDELKKQQRVDREYRGTYDDLLRSRHVLWAQTFREGELEEALNSCALAIMNNELVAEPTPALETKPIPRQQASPPEFPTADDEPGD